jgi:putative transposase
MRLLFRALGHYCLHRAELLKRFTFRTKAEAETALFQFIEGWYNPHRLHSSLGYVSPINYERAYHQNAANPA